MACLISDVRDARLCNWELSWGPSIWPDTRQGKGWSKHYPLAWADAACLTIRGPSIPDCVQIPSQRIQCNVRVPASSQLPAVSVRNCEPWLQIELLISVHITYYILQPPPLYCHRYWTHAWTNMWPLWPFSRGFMSVLYAISWCNCELNCLCNSFLIK